MDLFYQSNQRKQIESDKVEYDDFHNETLNSKEVDL